MNNKKPHLISQTGYLERLSNIKKLRSKEGKGESLATGSKAEMQGGGEKAEEDEMVVNMEWGTFPRTPWPALSPSKIKIN